MDEIPKAAWPGTSVRGRGEPARPALTISEAARVCGVNRRIIRQHRQAGEFPGAFRDQDGVWRIPMEDLRTVVLRDDPARTPEKAAERAADEIAAEVKVERLRTEVAVLQERLRAAELIALEREKRVEDLRLILRLLPAAASLLPASSGSTLPSSRTVPSLTAAPVEAGAGGDQPVPQAPPVPVRQGAQAEDVPGWRQLHRVEEPGSAGVAPAVNPVESVLHLPDLPEATEPTDRPVEGPLTTEGKPAWLWAPEDVPPREEDDEFPHRQTPRFFGPPLDVSPRRRRWPPWRRSWR